MEVMRYPKLIMLNNDKMYVYSDKLVLSKILEFMGAFETLTKEENIKPIPPS